MAIEWYVKRGTKQWGPITQMQAPLYRFAEIGEAPILASYALGRNNGSQSCEFWGATGMLADRSLRGLAASLGRDAAAAPDLGRLAATADALAGPLTLKWRLAGETRPGLRLGISLWLRLCVVVCHDFLDLGYGGVGAASQDIQRRPRRTPSRSGFRPAAISAHNVDLNDLLPADWAFSNRCCVSRVDKSKNSLVCSVACAANF